MPPAPIRSWSPSAAAGLDDMDTVEVAAPAEMETTSEVDCDGEDKADGSLRERSKREHERLIFEIASRTQKMPHVESTHSDVHFSCCLIEWNGWAFHCSR